MSGASPRTVTERLRRVFNPLLARLGAALAQLGIQPDWITIAGLILVAAAALLLARGDFLPAALLLLISLPLDALDGAVARAQKREGAFGMVLDSSLDRYADGFIFVAFSYYFAVQARLDLLTLSLLALVGSFLVSYVRARAEDARVAVSATVGIFTRLERVVALLIMTFAAGLLESALPLEIGIIALALGTNATALQRLWHVRKILNDRGD